MGSQKMATKRKPTAGHSGARKSAKENIVPPLPKQSYFKPRPAYKKVTFAEDLDEETNKGEAKAATTLVSMQNRVQTGWSVFEHVYRKVFNVCRN
jgi:hypothetical protein